MPKFNFKGIDPEVIKRMLDPSIRHKVREGNRHFEFFEWRKHTHFEYHRPSIIVKSPEVIIHSNEIHWKGSYKQDAVLLLKSLPYYKHSTSSSRWIYFIKSNQTKKRILQHLIMLTIKTYGYPPIIYNYNQTGTTYPTELFIGDDEYEKRNTVKEEVL